MPRAELLSVLPDLAARCRRPLLAATLVVLDGGTLRLAGVDGQWCDLTDADGALREALHALDGMRTWAELPAWSEPQLTNLAVALLARRMLVDASPSKAAQLTLVGSGELARAVAAQLCIAMPLRLRVVDDRPPTRLGCGPTQFLSGAAALVSWLRQRGLADEHHRISVGPHWTQLDTENDLVVLATGTVEPDRAITEHLLRQDLPYLLVRAHHGHASVGPLVAAHSPACLRCLDLSRSRDDPSWPQVLSSLLYAPATPSPVASGWAAAMVAANVEWFLADGRCDLEASTLEMDQGATGLRRRSWHRHSDCACGWEPVVSADEELIAC